MRARLLPGLAIATALSLTGCMADDFQANSGTGRVSVDVNVNSDVTDAPVSRSEASRINAEDLMLRLSAEDGSFSQEWKYEDFPSDGEYVIGTYLMEAYYGTADSEGFDSPYYYGSTSFQIRHNQTSSISFEVALGNSMITLNFEQSFKDYLSDFTALLTTTSGKTLRYASTDEGNAVYVKPGNISLAIDCTLPSGQSGSFHVTDFEVQPKNHYTMNLGINHGDPDNPGAGSVILTISYDDKLGQEPYLIEITDELMAASAPIITPSFDTTQTLSLPEGDTPTAPLAMTLVAQGGFASVLLTTDSPSLIQQHWPREIELLSSSQSDRDKLGNMGLKVLGLYQNPEQMAQLDFTGVIPNLTYIDYESNNNTFTVKVTDRNGKESDPVSFTVNTTEIKCQILSHEMLVGSDNLKLEISYNGKNAKDNIQIYYRSELGSYTLFTVNSITDNGDGTYLYDLSTSYAPKESTKIEVKVSYLGKDLESVLECGEPDFTLAPYDSYATFALVDLGSSKFDIDELLTKLQFSVSKDGGAFSDVNVEKVAGTDHLKISGLSAGASYALKAEGTLNDKASSARISFQTEAATQLPNNGMDNWFYEQPTTQYQRVFYPGTSADTPWSTMNALTTSTRGTGNSIVSYGGTSYRAYSGTQSVTAQGLSPKVGNDAAYIATVGWGSGNTALGGSRGKCENVTAGTLSLDKYAFSSRPMSLSFYYQYKAKNSADYGLVEIKVLDSNGSEICAKSQQLTSAEDWTLVTLDMSYPVEVKKAAFITVGFKSSDNSACLEYNENNMSTPPGANYTDGRYTGSELLVDEIILNY